MGGVERMQHSMLVSQCRVRATGWMGGVERMQHSILVSQCRVRETGWMGGVERMQHSILVSVRTGLQRGETLYLRGGLPVTKDSCICT